MEGYQNIVLDGKAYGSRERRSKSKFFNEGKWDNFIAPLLPKDCRDQTFIEYGCNYGMYLKKAKALGFKRVIGVEMSRTVCQTARRYVGQEAEVIQDFLDQRVYRDNWLEQFPAADYVLLSNFHYHIYLAALLHFIDLLRRKVRYVIVVSAEDAIKKLYHAKGCSESVRKYFKDWTEVKSIERLPGSDPSPRNMFSILFKSDIERVPIADIIARFGPHGKRFYAKVKRDVEAMKLSYPMTHPLLLTLPHRNLNDGNHRLAVLELAGETSVLVRTV